MYYVQSHVLEPVCLLSIPNRIKRKTTESAGWVIAFSGHIHYMWCVPEKVTRLKQWLAGPDTRERGVWSGHILFPNTRVSLKENSFKKNQILYWKWTTCSPNCEVEEPTCHSWLYYISHILFPLYSLRSSSYNMHIILTVKFLRTHRSK